MPSTNFFVEQVMS